MATNILSLPTDDLAPTVTCATSQDGEWQDTFALAAAQTVNNVTATSWIDLTGIALAMNLRSSGGKVVKALSTADGTMLNGGPSGQIGFSLPQSVMAGLPPDTYTGHIRAMADGHTRVIGKATVIHAASD